MKRSITLTTAAFGLLALLLAGCEQPTNSNSEGDGSSGDSAPSAGITDTQAANEVEDVQTNIDAAGGPGNVVGWLGTSLTFTPPRSLNPNDYSSADEDPAPNIWEYTITVTEDFTQTLIIEEKSSKYEWRILWNGTDSDGRTYDDWILVEGSEAKDSTSASYTFYNSNKSNVQEISDEHDWNITENNDRYTWVYTYKTYASGSVDSTGTYHVAIDTQSNKGEVDYIIENGTTTEYEAGWKNGGRDGRWNTPNDSGTWGDPGSTDPDDFLSNDEPSI
jgi:hypothetical protein